MAQATIFGSYRLEPPRRRSLGAFAAAGLVAACVVVLWTATASAAYDDTVVTFGNWTVHKTAQPSAAGSRCFAVHQGYGTIQLHYSGLFVLLPEKPRGYRYWIDSNAASGMQLASLAEQESASLDIAGKAFAAMQIGRRLRMEILTFTKVLEVKLDLAGITEAIAFLARDPACRS